MVATLIVIAALIVVLTLLNLKTSRSDGTYMGRIHPFRKLMFYIMPTRSESIVLYDDYASVEELERYLEQVNKRFHVDVTHAIVAAIANGMKKAPSMNRFVVGRRLYQRKGIWITFSMKRKKLDKQAKLAAVKRLIPEDQSFFGLCAGLEENIKVERSDTKTYLDKELGLLSKIPRPVLKVGVSLLKWLDYNNLLPADFIKNDAMYTGVFAANLGSLGMNAGYHHLYEWGTCPLFIMIGAIEERPVVVDGQVVVKRVIPLRFTYDERIDDGLNAGLGIKGVVDALEHPFELLGCVAADGSDDHPIGDPPASKPIPAGCLGADGFDPKNARAHAA
ncbi:MAG: 2-oxo acid dehydrogenase subunit E2 [Myxococcales bacterium]|nr:2-oxo acid dehydrogenase subunit E2 [Myxococcales bacterium]MCB9732528.1 2-oxo acid dehydrogenase subunit E2 [Deltaproteobacteria bacterium]